MTLSIKDQIREAAEQDLEKFITLVHPNRVLGNVHKELIKWSTREGAKSHQLWLLPRDHQKSALMAYRVAWEITKNPAIRILYISSTANLATKQLKFIKDILTSDIYTYYWPNMVNKEESKREKWTESEISVDHPLRKEQTIRDPTVFTAGLTTGIVGLHCDIAVMDDVVVDENAYTAEGRNKVRLQASYLASIAGADSRTWVCGTRYHPLDLYHSMGEMIYEDFDVEGNILGSVQLFEIFERQVESSGDGTGEFIWPRMQTPDGRWFGFNAQILSKKKSQYADLNRFRAQYYNNPNDLSEASIRPEMFQYYDRKYLAQYDGKWYLKNTRLNVVAAVDFAYSLNRKADFTCIVVVGIDAYNNYYVLDIDRFKTQKISDYFDHILRLHVKWDFRKIRMEVTAAQEVIVKDLKENYLRPHGLALTIDEHRPTSRDGKKEERIEAILQPKYNNRQIYHYNGGNCQLLEEELVMSKPAHDDIKDCLASAVDFLIPPTRSSGMGRTSATVLNFGNVSRFGGVR